MEFDVTIEIPKGQRNKYEVDHTTGRIRLDRMLFTATRYPADYGFVPDTLAEDGNPIDALVMVAEPTFPGCQITARVIAVFWMRDEKGPDAKVLCVPPKDPRFAGTLNMDDVPADVRSEIAHFFDTYNYKDLEPGKSSEVRGWQPRRDAELAVIASRQRFEELTGALE